MASGIDFNTKSAAITPLLNKPQRHKGHEEEEEEDKRGCRAGFGMITLFYNLAIARFTAFIVNRYIIHRTSGRA
ncbi:MAG TPA: hypothetical protein DDZ80_23230 [Cyanobacteria bacterium UBA8803]|nr:hypothetical protein [Cyanobacteria bacterium UBA8803]